MLSDLFMLMGHTPYGKIEKDNNNEKDKEKNIINVPAVTLEDMEKMMIKNKSGYGTSNKINSF